MTQYIIVDNDDDVWERKSDGEWVCLADVLSTCDSAEGIINSFGGTIYKKITLDEVPTPEPRELGAFYQSRGRTYIKYSNTRERNWICATSGATFTWSSLAMAE